MSSKADRLLIALALIILLLSLGGIFGMDSLMRGKERHASDAIAEIVDGSGDIRVKYSDEIRWQKSRQREKLMINDSIFAGENSKVELAVGQSRLKLDENTLIVLRKDTVFNSLNLNYGGLSGLLAKNDKLVVETANGEKFEMNANTASKISIQKIAGRTQVKVIEGSAKLIKNGNSQTLTSRDTVSIEEKFVPDPLKFTAPTQIIRYSFDGEENLRFAWKYASGRGLTDKDRFTIEFSGDPSFKLLFLREEIEARNEFTTSVTFPREMYYRVKDASGNQSDARRLRLLNPIVPEILHPQSNQIFDNPSRQDFALKIETTIPQPEAKNVVEIASDSDFRDVLVNKALLEPSVVVSLPTGIYFVRARSEYKQLQFDGSPLQTDWSEVRQILIRDKIEALTLAQIRLPTLVTIPNRKYSPKLYSAATTTVQTYLKDMEVFRRFFAPLKINGHDLMVQRDRAGESPIKLTGPEFPPAWIAPGNLNVRYQLQSLGRVSVPTRLHTMRIELEPPNELQGSKEGALTWSPLLLTHNYEGEIMDSAGQVFIFKTRKSHYAAQLAPGTRYRFRVRALNSQDRPISDWSAQKEFETAKPPVEEPPEIILSENEPELEPEQEREPAQEGTSLAKIEETVRRAWEKVGYWIWVGSGMNFIDVQTASNRAEISYQNMKGPSFFAEGGYLSKSRWGGIFGYKRTPGEVQIQNVTINNAEFVWDTFSLEAIYGLPYVGTLFKKTLNWGLRLGFQHHSFPFLYIETGRVVNNSRSEMLAGSAGFFMETSGRWKQHLHMRYQHPLTAATDGGNSFEITPKISFDGSVGTSYMLTERFKTGLFWYGQWHNYDFVYQSRTLDTTGSQSLFYSNMEFRLGYDF